MTHSLTKEQQDGYTRLLILKSMVDGGKTYPVIFAGSERVLEPILQALLKEGAVTQHKSNYAASERGQEKVQAFRQKYREYLDMFDVYGTVDLATGEFGMACYFDDQFSSDNDPDGRLWQAHLAQSRWEDLRVAVAEFKKVNPVDIVFMSFLNEKRFDTTKSGWEIDLVLGDIWNEMLEVANSNLHVAELAYDADEGGKKVPVSGEDVVRDIITKGTAVSLDLLKTNQEKQAAYKAAMAEYNAEERNTSVLVAEEEIVEVEYIVEDPFLYYDPWYDPYYVSPVWTVPLWALLL